MTNSASSSVSGDRASDNSRSLRSQALLERYREIASELLTVVDVETTGSSAGRDRVIEISVLQGRVGEGVVYQQTHTLNPGVPVPYRITQFTGITQAMVDEACHSEAVLPDYLPLLTEGVLTAHNLQFDYGFLQQEYERLGITFARSPARQFCTVKLSRLLLSHLPSRSLPKLVAHFGFDVGPSHRAEADTLACWLLADKLLTEIVHEPDADLLQRFVSQPITLNAAARLLGCAPAAAYVQLDSAGIAPLYTNRRGTAFYRREAVEQLCQSSDNSGT
ncbi:MAG: 3'-5' exonuclease [Cyanobacteria bacterium P01_D01_bin.123]